jgi:hypothetical protein
LTKKKGQATDIQIHAEEIIKMKHQINRIYAKHTKKPLDFIGKSNIYLLKYVHIIYLKKKNRKTYGKRQIYEST